MAFFQNFDLLNFKENRYRTILMCMVQYFVYIYVCICFKCVTATAMDTLEPVNKIYYIFSIFILKVWQICFIINEGLLCIVT